MSNRNEKRKTKAEAMTWFRCTASDWKDRKLEALTVAERWFLFQLHIEMIERAHPLNKGVVDFISRDQRVRPSTANSMIEKLIKHSFVFRIDGDLWSDAAEAEFAFREERTASKIPSKRLAAQKRWEKDKQNQRNAMQEKEIDIEGAAHGADAQIDNNPHQLKDEFFSSSTAFSRLDAEKPEAGEEIENRSSPVHPIDAPQVGEPFVGETDPSEVDDFDIRPSMPDLDTAPSPDQFESEPGSIVEAETPKGQAPSNPDGLTANRRDDNAFDLAAFVASFIASRIDLSTIEHEPTLEIVLPIAADISDVTGIDLETVSRFVEDHLWNARRWDDDAENTDDHPLAIPF